VLADTSSLPMQIKFKSKRVGAEGEEFASEEKKRRRNDVSDDVSDESPVLSRKIRKRKFFKLKDQEEDSLSPSPSRSTSRSLVHSTGLSSSDGADFLLPDGHDSPIPSQYSSLFDRIKERRGRDEKKTKSEVEESEESLRLKREKRRRKKKKEERERRRERKKEKENFSKMLDQEDGDGVDDEDETMDVEEEEEEEEEGGKRSADMSSEVEVVDVNDPKYLFDLKVKEKMSRPTEGVDDFDHMDEEDLFFLHSALRDVLYKGEDFGVIVPEYPFIHDDEELGGEGNKIAERAIVLGTATGISESFLPLDDISNPLESKKRSDRERERISRLMRLQSRIKSKRKKHTSGCAKTEGFYAIRPEDKWYTQRGLLSGECESKEGGPQAPREAGGTDDVTLSNKRKKTSDKRETRKALRRQAGGEFVDLDAAVNVSSLIYRGKRVKFGKSRIHDWGLFALERIEADEMVIEYIGEVVRGKIADIREERYEKQGMGSSYMFRIDTDIIDATRKGNVARFINHSCDPNCIAKVIQVQGAKKIGIYSARTIEAGEEITYDYKFPVEEEKIKCLCKSAKCRGSLN
jgi:hypothetical protein